MKKGRCLFESPRRVIGHGIRPILVAVALVVLSLALAACGTAGPGEVADGVDGTTSSLGGSIVHPTAGSDLVLQVATGGGFVPVEYNLTSVPEFSLYGDGRVIVTGPVMAIYPGPALPNLQTAVISEESVQAILAAAREAGLFNPTFDYGLPNVADAPTTTLVINAGDTTYRTEIYALGVEGAGGLSMEQQQARATVNVLRGKLPDLSGLVSEEVTWEPYQYSALAAYSQAVEPGYSPDPTDVQPNRLEWPLGDLGTVGEEVQPAGFRRAVISGDDLATLQPLLANATAITLWQSGEKEYRLWFRPLLPDEVG